MTKIERRREALAAVKGPKPATCVERTAGCCITHGTQGCLTSRRRGNCPSLPHEKKATEIKNKERGHKKAGKK